MIRFRIYFILLGVCGILSHPAFGQLDSSGFNNELDHLFYYSFAKSTTQYLSNVGGPSQNLTQPFGENAISFKYNELREQRLPDLNFRALVLAKRRSASQLYFRTGSKKEQQLALNHQQKVSKKLLLDFSLNNLTTEGYYLDERIAKGDYTVRLAYTDSSRSSFELNFGRHTASISENGGIEIDSLFHVESSKDALTVRSSDALNQNRFSEIGIHYTYKIGEIDSSEKRNFIFSNLNFGKRKLVFTDEDLDSAIYYSLLTFDSFPRFSFDSTIVRNFRYSFGSGFTLLESRLKGSVEMFTEYYNIIQTSKDGLTSAIDTVLHKDFFNYGLMLRANILNFKGLKFNINYQKYLEGYNKGDEYLNLMTTLSLKSHSFLILQLKRKLKHADYLLSNNYNRYYNWDYDHKLVRKKNLSFSYVNNKLHSSLSFNFDQMNNYLFINEMGQPSQVDKVINRWSFDLTSSQHLFKGLKFRVKARYQSGDHKYLRYPEFVGEGNIYYESKALSDNGDIKIGFSCRYFSSYQADRYLPSLQRFFLQEATSVGNYPFIDFFTVLNIQNASLFFEVTHLNYGLMSANYYTTPDYLAPDRSLKFGVVWELNN